MTLLSSRLFQQHRPLCDIRQPRLHGCKLPSKMCGGTLDTEAKPVTDFSQVDTIEAGRVAFELSQRHQHAAKLATEALAKGNTEEHAFLKYIEATLKPRSVGV